MLTNPTQIIFNFIWNRSKFERRLSFNAGVQLGLLTRVSYTFEKESVPEEIFEDDNRDRYQDFDIGLGLGFGVNFDLFFVDFRHYIGFRNVDKNITIDGTRLQPKAKNFNAEIAVGHFF